MVVDRHLHRSNRGHKPRELTECQDAVGLNRSHSLYIISPGHTGLHTFWPNLKSEPFAQEKGASFLWHPKVSEGLPAVVLLPAVFLGLRAERQGPAQVLSPLLLHLQLPRRGGAVHRNLPLVPSSFLPLRLHSHSWQCSLLHLCRAIFTSSSPWKEKREQMVPWAL